MNKIKQTLIPGSPEAKKKGCTCEPPIKDNYYINEHCPIHWHILMVSRTGKMHDHIIKTDSQNTVMIIGLILAVAVTFAYFLVTNS